MPSDDYVKAMMIISAAQENISLPDESSMIVMFNPKIYANGCLFEDQDLFHDLADTDQCLGEVTMKPSSISDMWDVTFSSNDDINYQLEITVSIHKCITYLTWVIENNIKIYDGFGNRIDNT